MPTTNSVWSVRPYGKQPRGLAFHGDWINPAYLAELLSGEDDGRVTEADVHDLLDLIEEGLLANDR